MKFICAMALLLSPLAVLHAADLPTLAQTIKAAGFASIRDDRWKLIRYPLIEKTQLFDLQADPHEMADLAGQPEYAGKIKELTGLLEKTRREYGDTAPLHVANPSPSAWTPPAPGNEQPGQKKKSEAQKSAP